MNAERELIKRQAGSALRKAGRAHLCDLGLRPVSSSPRQWISDRGWWLINVEFQASSWSIGSYLNVGVQYLWTVRDYRTFGAGPRRYPIPECGQFAELEGPEDKIRSNADAVGRGARDAVLSLVAGWSNDHMHLRAIALNTASDAWRALDAAIAVGVLGQTDEAISRFEAIPAQLDDAVGWQAALAADCHRLAQHVPDSVAFRHEVDTRIDETRRRLRLPAREGTSFNAGADSLQEGS